MLFLRCGKCLPSLGYMYRCTKIVTIRTWLEIDFTHHRGRSIFVPYPRFHGTYTLQPPFVAYTFTTPHACSYILSAYRCTVGLLVRRILLRNVACAIHYNVLHPSGVQKLCLRMPERRFASLPTTTQTLDAKHFSISLSRQLHLEWHFS